MQKESIRMYAKAINFTTVQVYLSTKYYGGVSSKFYIKDLDTSDYELLHGDAGEEIDGFRIYTLRTSISLGTRYLISDAYGLTCHIDFSPIALTEEFDEQYYYDQDDLGYTYTRKATTFKVWSPLSTAVSVKLYKKNHIEYYDMERQDKGVYSITIDGNLDETQYTYIVSMNTQSIETVDPYAYASTANMERSIVVDINNIHKQDYTLPEFKNYTDAVIYELSVRDFSMDQYGGIKHKGKFLGFTETANRTELGYLSGVEYLSNLGITHVQLLPVNDFATVDEDFPYELYNWGYDPAQYNVTEGSYVTDPNDGYRRIEECVKMIDSLHRHKLRVILDVVYNHMHDVNHSALERTVPYYFFRRDKGQLSNGSWCGNDLNTTARMCRKYILDMCRRWQVLYGCDGFRMDLMGIVDVDTVQAIYDQGKSIDPSFMLYGEGWDMGTLPDHLKAKMGNHARIPQVGFFNDYFRDVIRGNNAMETKGYISGDTYKTNEAINILADYNKFTSITQSINYVECHDNATIYDKFLVSNNDEDEKTIRKRCTLALVMTILAQGVPFIHAGQEFYDTKRGHGNSYNAGDHINAFDWARRDESLDNVRLIQDLILLRRKNICFRYHTFEDMRNHITISNINHRMVEYHLTQDTGEYREFKVYVNPSPDYIKVHIEEGYTILLSLEDEHILNQELEVHGVSFVICAK